MIQGHEILSFPKRTAPTNAASRIKETASNPVKIPQRTPTFCPGCPHRDSSSVLIEVKRSFNDAEYMQKHHNHGPVDLLFHGDTGCYTMLMFEPNAELMHNYSGMGLGGGTGAGIDKFITNKQAVFMGDSTFFHSGMIAISDAIKHNQDITFIILDNGTTAMTGHQPTAAQEFDLVGRYFACEYSEFQDGLRLLGFDRHEVHAQEFYFPDEIHALRALPPQAIKAIIVHPQS